MDSICVFCGSRDGNNPAYVAAAQATGRAIARRGWKWPRRGAGPRVGTEETVVRPCFLVSGSRSTGGIRDTAGIATLAY